MPTDVRHAFRFEFDRGFLRAAFKRDYAWNAVRGLGLFALILIGARLWMGYFEPVSVIAVVLGAAFVAWRVWRTFGIAVQRTFDLWSRQAPDRVIEYRLDDAGFEVRLADSHARYEWAGLRRLWRHDDVWILEIVRNLSVFFPPAEVPEEARDFVLERCRAAGVRV